ncbi:MAG: hypothetical protein ABSA91_13825 [Acidimicrobiales bacterium]
MQNAVADQRVQEDALRGTTTISLRNTPPAGPGQGRSEIEVIPESPPQPGPPNDLDAVFSRDLLQFLGDFKSAAPKSSTVRRSGQTVAQDTPVTRDAPHQDVLFDFLRAYEAAPKMRPLSLTGTANETKEPAGKRLGRKATPPPVAQAEDTPFRVPPYVSSVSDNTAAEEALLDVDAVWLEPEPSPAPVMEPLGRASGAKRQGQASTAKRPAPLPVAKDHPPVLVADKPAPAPAAKVQPPVPVAVNPAPAPAAPASAAPAPAAPVRAAAEPSQASVARRPDAKPAPAQVRKRTEPRPVPAPAPKPLGPAAARAKAIEEGLIV